jgi:hypothetical protein
MDNKSQKTTTTVSSYAVIAIVADLSMLGIVVLTVTITIPLQQQQAEAAVGCPPGPAQNASKGRCIR